MYKRQEVNSVQSQLCRAVFFHACRTLPSYPALTRVLTFLIYSQGINDHFHSSFSLAARMGAGESRARTWIWATRSF